MYSVNKRSLLFIYLTIIFFKNTAPNLNNLNYRRNKDIYQQLGNYIMSIKQVIIANL